MIYAPLVNCRVFVSLRPGGHIVADEELWPITGAIGTVASAGADFLRMQANSVTLIDDEGAAEEMELEGEPMELTLHQFSIMLVQLLEEGDAIEEGDDDEEEDDDPDASMGVPGRR